MFGGWRFVTDLAWEHKSPQTLPHVRELRMKRRRKERGRVMNGGRARGTEGEGERK